MAIKITTDLLKADMPYPFTGKSKKVYEQLYKLFENEDEGTIEKILEAAATFENEPFFLNLAAQYYDREDLLEKAREINDLAREKFPLFVFWRINESMEAFKDRDAEKMKELLGEEMRLEKLYPERKLFHFSEYIGYTRAAMLYYSLSDNETEMLKRVAEGQILSERYDFDISILYQTTSNFLSGFIQPEEIPVFSLPSLPDFHFKEIEQLYQYGLDLPDEIYNSLLQKDRKLLIEDLEKLIQHAIDDFEEFSNGEMPDESTFFVWHALFLLKDLEATESLPAVLHFFNQSEELADLYLGLGQSEFVWQVFYVLGKDQLRELVNFGKELVLNEVIKTVAIEALTQIGLYHPEKRLEIESYLRELLLYCANEEMQESDIFIEEVTDKVLEAIGEGGFHRLFPEVEKLLGEDKLQTFSLIDWTEFVDIYNPEKFDARDYQKDFKPRQEIYREFITAVQDEEEYDDYEDVDDNIVDKMAELDNEESNNESNYLNYSNIPLKPYIKTEPDVGRNDFCPCGSGKKYKKCHGKS